MVIEPGAELGGAASQASVGDFSIDRHFQALSDGNTALCGLLGDLGALGRITWRETQNCVIAGGRQRTMVSPFDALRANDLAMGERLRVAAAAIYATRLKRYGLNLDAVPAFTWLRETFGDHAFEAYFRPTLESRFGANASEVPAYWAWLTLTRQAARKRVHGHLQGGAPWLVERLRERLLSGEGELHLNARITALAADGKRPTIEFDRREEQFDAVICTLPTPLLTKLATGRLTTQLPTDITYQGVVTAALVLRAPLSGYYSSEVLDADLGFHTLTEATHVQSTHTTNGRYLVYLDRYCGPHTEAYKAEDARQVEQAIGALSTVFPHFSASDVETAVVSRRPYAEPLWSIGYLKRRPALRTGDTGVYLCTSAQSYPRPSGWDTSVALAREVSAKVSCDLSH